MKKVIILIITFLLFLPSTVTAEECKKDNITIKSIQLKDKASYVEEVSPTIVDTNKIDMDLKMYEVGDYVEYKLNVSNTSDENYYFNKDSLGINSDYFNYSISYKDNSNIIKAHDEKEIVLKVQYKKEIDKLNFYSGKYNDRNNIVINLSTNQSIIDIMTNPNTRRTYILLFIISIIVIFTNFVYVKNKKVTNYILLILLAIIVIPSSVHALCECSIDIDSNILIVLAKPNPCTFNGELVQGAEYVKGQYTYRYMQERTDSTWQNIENDGWGVMLTDKNSTNNVETKLCTVINDKPIVSMSYMFNNSNTNHIDLSSFDTSNVVNMVGMFNGVQNVEEYDLLSFNTENVKNLDIMFKQNTSLKKINLSTFDTKNVTSHSTLFYGDSELEEVNMDNWDFRKSGVGGGHFISDEKLKKVSCKNWKLPENFSYWLSTSWSGGSNSSVEEIDVTGWDLSETKNIQSLFYNSNNLKKIIGLDTWDTSNIENMNRMFYGLSSIEELDLSSFNTSKVINMEAIFGDCNNLESLNLSNFDFSNYNNGYGLTGYLFDGTNESLKNLNVSNTKYGKYMVFTFNYTRNLESIDLTGVDTSLVEDMHQAFYQLDKLKEINILDFDTSNVTNMSGMFNGCSSLKKVDLNGLDVRKVQNFEGLISNCTSLEELGLSNLDFSNYQNSTHLYHMNGRYVNGTVKKLNLENSIFSPNSQDMLRGTYEEINLKNVDTSHVISMDYMLHDLPNIKELDLSSFDTSNVRSMYYLFKYPTKIENLDLSHFDLSSIDPNGNALYGMLNGINSAKRIDLSGLDLSYRESGTSTLGLNIYDNYLEELVTPKNLNIGNDRISINKRMYAKGDNVGIIEITKDTPTNTIYKDHPWN